MSKNILGIFDGGDIESITALIGKLEESSFDYLKLEGDGVKIVIGKNGMSEVTQACAPKAETPAEVPAATLAAPVANAPTETAVHANAVVASTAKPVEAVLDQAGIVVIKSPSYGIFYAQSEPGAPAYVKLGDTVKAGDTMGLLEIMKTFNAISSEVDGEVVAIHVQNQDVLEPDQPLFSLKVQ